MASNVFENLLYLAVVCGGVAIVEASDEVDGVPRFALMRTRGGGFGGDVRVRGVGGGGLDVG